MSECPYCYDMTLTGNHCHACGISIYIPARLRYRRDNLADGPEDYDDTPGKQDDDPEDLFTILGEQQQ